MLRRLPPLRSAAWALALGFALALAPAASQAPSPAAPPAPPAAAPPAAAAPVPAAAERAAERLRSFLERRRIPALSVAVGLRGEVVYAEAFGVADLESGAPATVDSVFPLGSTTKVLTSLALGRLVEAGRLDLDAPIQTYVPYFPKKEHPVTARQLAGHLAGVRDYDMAAGEYDNRRAFASVREAVAVFASDPLTFEPGTKYAYSAYNFVLLSASLEGASGKDYLTLVEESILAPLGLVRTGPNRSGAPAPGLVTSYAPGLFGLPVKAAAVDVSNKWAAGGFASTPAEMVRLGNAVLAGKVVKPATFALLTTPQALKDGTSTGAGYGLGWRSGLQKLPLTGRELRGVHHGGVANGGLSFFILFPEAGLAVALQGNLRFEPFADFQREALAVADLFLQAPDAGTGAGRPAPR